MHILPPLETVKDIAATQQYDVLPLSCEILSAFITNSCTQTTVFQYFFQSMEYFCAHP